MMGTEKDTIEQSKNTQKSALVFSMFYVLGTLSHVPQSFYITANDYWMYKFKNPNETYYNSSENATKTDLQANFTAYYSIVSNISMVSGLVVAVFLLKKLSPDRIIVATLSSLLGLLVITIMFAWVDTDSWQTGFFIISLLIGSLLNLIGACFLLAIFFLAMKFPAVYLGAVLSGQSICGIMSSLIQIITLAMGTSSLVNASLYFVIGTLFVAVVQVVFMTVLTKQQYYQDQINKEEKQEKMIVDRAAILKVAKKISLTLTTMVFAAGMMVAMHPGVTSLVESTNKGHGKWGDLFFVPVCTFLAYNVSDFIGRECSFRFKWINQKKETTRSPEENSFIPSENNSGHQTQESETAHLKSEIKSQWILLVIGILRLSLVPITLFCNIQPRNHLPVVFGEDWEYAIVIIVLAFSGGYVMNFCIVLMPMLCTREEMKISSILTILVMVASLAVCSFFGPLLISLV